MELAIDPKRAEHPDTGIYVRARLADGGFGAVDIAQLEAVVAMILSHDMVKWGPVP